MPFPLESSSPPAPAKPRRSRLARLAPVILAALVAEALISAAAFAQTGGAYYLPKHNETPSALIQSRVAQVVARENERRAKAGNPLLPATPELITEYDRYKGPQSFIAEGTKHLNLMGGGTLHVGDSFVITEPRLARYNSEMLVYHFEGDKIVRTEPFRHFAIRALEGDPILLTRVFFSESSRESEVWRKEDWAHLRRPPKGDEDVVAEAYGHLAGWPIHFGAGGLWVPVYNKPRVEITVSKQKLLELADAGFIEIGLTGPNSVLPEIIVLEPGWPELLRQPRKFYEAAE